MSLKCQRSDKHSYYVQVTLADTLLETLGNDQADFVELLLRTELSVTYEDLEKVYSDVSRQSSKKLLKIAFSKTLM
ncbi:hypothetical protein DPMN_029674 [Dreissena polymorpha]|uniref:Uncharacterized protein n=1 Tax=Dreissena polymorpha TaxID=45954 RepID=A0A9D4LZM3_DREPO|nr:hypothetical protein DPMN_029674 [Dreissena polymorpha]